MSGLPEEEDEDTDDIVVRVAAAAGVNISPDDIDISHRLPRRTNRQGQQQPATIIVKFVRRTVRNKLYNSKKHLKDKTARNIGYTRNNRLYISENLTPTNKPSILRGKPNYATQSRGNSSGPKTARSMQGRIMVTQLSV